MTISVAMFARLKKLYEHAVKRPSGTGEDIVDLHGVKIPLDMPVLSEKIVTSIRSGMYEYDEGRHIPRIIEADERVLELGVGIGFVSALILGNQKVEDFLGFEANPALIPWVDQIFKLNEVEGEIRNAILGHIVGSGDIDFYVRKNFWASSLSPEPWGYESVVKVPAVEFNGVIEEFRPTLIVCDIEGGELDLFEHADLRGVNKVYMEIHQKVLGRKGIKQLFDTMSSKDFHYDQWNSSGAVVLFSHIDR